MMPMAQDWYPVNGKWRNLRAEIEEARELGDGKKQEAISDFVQEYYINPMAHFIPHGVRWRSKPVDVANGKFTIQESKYPKQYCNDGVAFLNDWENDGVIMLGPNQQGKEQPYDADVITPSGKRKMGDLCVGDMVIASDGNAYPIEWIQENGDKEIYCVEFDGGEVSVECGAEHLWVYLKHSRAFLNSSQKRGKPRVSNSFNKWEVFTTEQIMAAQGDGSPQKRGYVPKCSPVCHDENIDIRIPYTIGVLLGDGCLRGGRVEFTSVDREIVDHVAKEVGNMAEVVWDGMLAKLRGAFRAIRPELVRLGMQGKASYEKAIPHEYLYSDKNTRLMLLRGLMDTDGSADSSGTYEYYSVSEKLSTCVAQLVRSLGGKATIRVKPSSYTDKNGDKVKCRDCYRVRVQLSDLNPFLLKRKADRWRPIERRPDRIVHRVFKTGETKPCRCIQVASPDRTYLTGDYIVTHNSVIGAVWTGLHTCKCDENWPVFQHTNITCPEWRGPKTWIVASYSWDNVGTIWERVRFFFPRAELGQYSPSWGAYENERGTAKNMSFGDGRKKELNLTSGSRIIFLCYTQQQMHWEGFTCDGGTFDEQVPKEKWIGWNRGTTTRGEYTPFAMMLTGHVLDDRPDTGAAGWIKRQLWDGQNTMGKSIGRYHLSVESTPEAIIPKKKKEALHKQWADPKTRRSEKDERAAVARYWGGWEEGSGLVFDEFSRAIHVINPLWERPPDDWTKWRSIDYGDNGVTCCSWFAVSPQGWAVCYRVLYERGLLVAETAQKIIELSGNTRTYDGEDVDPVTGTVYKRYIENQSREVFYNSILDSRSAAQNKQGPTLLELFERYGLELNVASGQRNEIQIPRLKDWLRVDWSKDHPWRKDAEGKPAKGRPALYFFDGACEQGIVEVESLQKDKNDPRKIARKQPDHFVDTAKYWASDDPCFMGDIYRNESDTVTIEGPKAPYTGY